jgi:dnaB-like helicase-like
MIGSVELQVISKILSTDNQIELDTLLEYDESFYSVFKEHILFIQDHRTKYGDIPDVFTFQAQFPDVTLIKVTEPLTYLVRELKKNKQQILLVETFNKLKDLGSSDVTDAWTYLSKQCEKSEELSDSRPLNLVSDAKQRAQQVLEFSHQTRIPTGFPEIDKLMYGGLSTVEELVIILARTNTGKAQPLWSPVLTPNGWTTMGELKIGDTVVGKNNDNGKVIKIFPQGVKDYYKITFDDDTSTYACDDHLWEVKDIDNNYDVITTKQIRNNIENTEYYIDLSTPVKSFRSSILERKAYVAQMWNEFGSKCRNSWRVNIPDKLLSDAFIYNARSLGIFTIEYDDIIECDLSRNSKQIISIEYAGQTECQCILLDNKSHTYITNDYTVTHNSWVCTKMMATAQVNGFPVLYYSPEMQSSYLGTRFDTWKQHFKNNQLMQGNYTKEYIEYIDNLSNESTGAYVLEDKDVSGESVNVKTIATLVKKHNIKLVIVDGLSYLEDSKHADKDHNRYKNICLDLFKMSKQYGCAVVVAMQANRDTKNIKDDKGDPIPTLFNAESSDHPGRICTQAFALRQVFDKHVLDIRLEKSRNAANQKPVFSYSWDVNTGNMQYIPGEDDMTTTQDVIPTVVPSSTVSTEMAFSDDLDADTSFDIDEDIEF